MKLRSSSDASLLNSELPITRAPLGAIWDGTGVHFSVYSLHAEMIELVLFDPTEPDLVKRSIPLERKSYGIWETHVPRLAPGALYNYRAHGPFRPEQGHRFDSKKLLLDPYARAIDGVGRWHTSMQSVSADSGEPFSNPADSSKAVPRCRVIDPGFAWQCKERPSIPWSDTVLYELHVKGMTMKHPDISETYRGTYLGLCQEPILDHWRRLGVTSLDLMPIHFFIDERHLAKGRLTNYWGYAPLGYFAPEPRYATRGGDPVVEFKTMVDTLHRAGFEVIIDVVFNHTGEGSAKGSTICFRGLDHKSYYRLDDSGHPIDVTGCGNTLDITQPSVLRLVQDSLRYWALEMGVDGFRFDLAATLGRDPDSFRRNAAFFMSLFQDPILSRVKCIAEPWDIGLDGYQLGSFPRGWAEWNGRYRDTVRSFWKMTPDHLAEFATRISGSSDLFDRERGPGASINFITAHDGFTLEDLVSYDHRHNEANQEQNRDGHGDNRSSNWGVEGPTKDKGILEARDRAKRNMIATLALSLGVPMLSHGDERLRTQRGNNNAYCQDNEISWVDWRSSPRQKAFESFVQRVFALRKRFDFLRRQDHFFPEPCPETGWRDVYWIKPDGVEFDERDWWQGRRHALGILVPQPRSKPEQVEVEEAMMLLINGSPRPISFSFPEPFSNHPWRLLLDTTRSRTPDKRVSKVATVASLSLQCFLYTLESHDNA